MKVCRIHSTGSHSSSAALEGPSAPLRTRSRPAAIAGALPPTWLHLPELFLKTLDQLPTFQPELSFNFSSRAPACKAIGVSCR